MKNRNRHTTPELRVIHKVLQGFLQRQAYLPRNLRAGRKTILKCMNKIDGELMARRREKIFKLGASHARKKLPAQPWFERRELGSMESYNYYEGYASVDKAFVNPYRPRQRF